MICFDLELLCSAVSDSKGITDQFHKTRTVLRARNLRGNQHWRYYVVMLYTCWQRFVGFISTNEGIYFVYLLHSPRGWRRTSWISISDNSFIFTSMTWMDTSLNLSSAAWRRNAWPVHLYIVLTKQHPGLCLRSCGALRPYAHNGRINYAVFVIFLSFGGIEYSLTSYHSNAGHF